jgi:hypothetical protein
MRIVDWKRSLYRKCTGFFLPDDNISGFIFSFSSGPKNLDWDLT